MLEKNRCAAMDNGISVTNKYMIDEMPIAKAIGTPNTMNPKNRVIIIQINGPLLPAFR